MRAVLSRPGQPRFTECLPESVYRFYLSAWGGLDELGAPVSPYCCRSRVSDSRLTHRLAYRARCPPSTEGVSRLCLGVTGNEPGWVGFRCSFSVPLGSAPITTRLGPASAGSRQTETRMETKGKYFDVNALGWQENHYRRAADEAQEEAGLEGYSSSRLPLGLEYRGELRLRAVVITRSERCSAYLTGWFHARFTAGINTNAFEGDYMDDDGTVLFHYVVVLGEEDLMVQGDHDFQESFRNAMKGIADMVAEGEARLPNAKLDNLQHLREQAREQLAGVPA